MSIEWDSYEAVLRDLRAQRANFDKAIAAIEALRPVEKPPVADKVFSPTVSAEPLTIIGAAMLVLHEAGKPLHVRVILKGVEAKGVKLNSADPANMLGNILNRRSKRKGDVARVGQGIWALAGPQFDL